MNYKNILQSKISPRVLWCIGALALALCIFQAGIFVGYHKAAFSYRFGDNYHKTFGSFERGGMGMMDRGEFPGFPPGEFTPAYGVTGTIIKISLPTIIVAGTDKVEKVVLVNEKTMVRHFREDVNVSEVKVGDFIVVIGSPNESAQIDAKLIRIMPPPPDFNALNATNTNKK